MIRITETQQYYPTEADSITAPERRDVLDLAVLPQERAQELLSAADVYIVHHQGTWKEVAENAVPTSSDCLVLIKQLSTQEKVVYQVQAKPALHSILSSTELGQSFPNCDFVVDELQTLDTNDIKVANFSHPRPAIEVPAPQLR